MKTKRKARKPSKATSSGRNMTLAQWHNYLISNGESNESASGEKISEQRALGIAAFWCGVRVISQTIASLPRFVYAKTSAGREVARDHPAYRILHDEPNADCTAYTLFEVLASNLLVYGNGYAIIQRAGSSPVQLSLVHASRVEPHRDEETRNIIYEIHNDDGTRFLIPSTDMLHIKGLGFDGLAGYPPVWMVRDALGLTKATERYGSKFFKNDARPSGILSHPGTLDQEATVRLRESWQRMYSGEGRSGIAVMEEGMTFTPITIANNNAQFLETRAHQVLEVCRILNIAPSKVHDHTHSTFSNIEHLDIEFAKHTIRPWLVNIEQELNRKLFTEAERRSGYYVEHNMDGLLRGDFESRQRGYQTARNGGWMSANEIRELENMNPIEGEAGDAYLINGNMISIETAMYNQVGVAPDRNADQPSDSDRSAQIEAVWEAYVPLFADVGARMASRECIAAKRIDVDKLGAWAGRFYQSHEESVTAALGVVFDSFYRQRCTITGEEYDPSAAHGLARRAANLYCQESRSKIVNGFSDQWLSRSGDAMVAHVKAVMQ